MLSKFAQYASSPKLAVLNTALLSVARSGDFDSVRCQPQVWGRWVESAVEVKSGRRRESLCGLAAWQREFPHSKVLLVGTGGVGLHEFFHSAPMQWCQ